MKSFAVILVLVLSVASAQQFQPFGSQSSQVQQQHQMMSGGGAYGGNWAPVRPAQPMAPSPQPAYGMNNMGQSSAAPAVNETGSEVDNSSPNAPFKLYVRENEDFTCDGKCDGFYASNWCNVFYRCFGGRKFEFLCALQTSGDRLWWNAHSTQNVTKAAEAQCGFPCDIGRECSSPGGVLDDIATPIADSTENATEIFSKCKPQSDDSMKNNNNTTTSGSNMMGAYGGMGMGAPAQQPQYPQQQAQQQPQYLSAPAPVPAPAPSMMWPQPQQPQQYGAPAALPAPTSGPTTIPALAPTPAQQPMAYGGQQQKPQQHQEQDTLFTQAQSSPPSFPSRLPAQQYAPSASSAAPQWPRPAAQPMKPMRPMHPVRPMSQYPSASAPAPMMWSRPQASTVAVTTPCPPSGQNQHQRPQQPPRPQSPYYRHF